MAEVVKSQLIQYMEEYICIYCGKVCKNDNSKRNHQRLCKDNPNRQNISEYTHNDNWRKAVIGRKGTNQFTKAKESGSPVPKGTMLGKESPFKGKSHTDETKKKISDSMKKVYRGKSIWRTQIEKRKSYAEKYFDDLFPQLDRNFHVLSYFLDLADVQKKLYIEIDGEQHYKDEKVVEHDKKRERELSEIGWTCIGRIRWSIFKAMTDEEKKKLISSLKEKLEIIEE